MNPKRPKILQVMGSMAFTVYIYISIAVFGIIGFPVCLFSRSGAYAVMKLYSHTLFHMLRALCGIRIQVHGTPPSDVVIVASKHQSFLDVLILMAVLPRAKFIMKRELLFAPLFGVYAWRTGAIAVRRTGRVHQMPALLTAASEGIARDPGQVVIYPEGTRVPPGQKRPYKRGVSLLYDMLNKPCVPVATNVGYFWGKNQRIKRPGLATVSFLDSIVPGIPPKQFLLELEAKIENASDDLHRQAIAQSGEYI